MSTLNVILGTFGDADQTQILKSMPMFILESIILMLPGILCLFMVHKNGGFPKE